MGIPEKYVSVATQTFQLFEGQETTIQFENKLKKGSLELVKNSENGLVEGVRFHLYSTSLSGQRVDQYATTNAQGVARFNDIPISGSTAYTVE